MSRALRSLPGLLLLLALPVWTGCNLTDAEDNAFTITLYQQAGDGYRELASGTVTSDQFIRTAEGYAYDATERRGLVMGTIEQRLPGLFALSYCGADPAAGSVFYVSQGTQAASFARCPDDQTARTARLFSIAPLWPSSIASNVLRLQRGPTADTLVLRRGDALVHGGLFDVPLAQTGYVPLNIHDEAVFVKVTSKRRDASLIPLLVVHMREGETIYARAQIQLAEQDDHRETYSVPYVYSTCRAATVDGMTRIFLWEIVGEVPASLYISFGVLET